MCNVGVLLFSIPDLQKGVIIVCTVGVFLFSIIDLQYIFSS